MRFMARWALGTRTLPGLAATECSSSLPFGGRESSLCRSGFPPDSDLPGKAQFRGWEERPGRPLAHLRFFSTCTWGAQLLLHERHEDAWALVLQVQPWTGFG